MRRDATHLLWVYRVSFDMMRRDATHLLCSLSGKSSASQYINGDIRTMGKQARLQPSVNTILQLDFSLLPAISTVPWGT
ncbi:hypothetical protein BDR07DRAFT_1610447 [Suillus spraguei]|nr:hypothetical protein BDR07DRAFT_1610447 [Suillus spraguei]